MNYIIKNKIYTVDYNITDNVIYLTHIFIYDEYRGKGFSKKIIDTLQKKHFMPIILECWPTLVDFYKKLGFYQTGNISEDEYIEMKLNKGIKICQI